MLIILSNFCNVLTYREELTIYRGVPKLYTSPEDEKSIKNHVGTKKAILGWTNVTLQRQAHGRCIAQMAGG